MKALLISMLYSIARRLFDDGLFARTQSMVLQLLNEDIPGDEKREQVRAYVRLEFARARSLLIDSIIQVVLLKFADVDFDPYQ